MKRNFILPLLLLATTTIVKPFSLTSPDIAIDLGTQNTLVCVVESDGEVKLIADIPSFVAIDSTSRKVTAVGMEAKAMYGKTPGGVQVIRPMQDGVIKDFDITEAMLRYIFKKATDYETGILRGPRIIVGVPCSVKDTDVRSIKDIAMKMGAREVHTIMEPVAAAIGADLPIEAPKGNMIVDIGGGTTDIVVTSLKAPVVARAVNVAGDALDRAIAYYIRQKFNLSIGEQTAEKIKKEIGAVWLKEGSQGKTMEVGGADVMTGIPRIIKLTSVDMVEATNECMENIIFAIRKVLGDTPPELATDITQSGILLVGGGALLRGIDKRIERDLGLKIKIPKDPLRAVVNGIGKVSANFAFYKETLFNKHFQSATP